jgi:hypothetical protein
MADRIGDLEIEHDMGYQRRAWAVQRIGLGMMLLLIAAAFTGVLGGRGPLASRTLASAGDSLRLEYKRFARHQAPSQLKVHFGPGLAEKSDSTVKLWLARDYVEQIDIERIDPEPESVRAGEERVTFEFKVSDPERPSIVTFNIRPTGPWSRKGSIGVEEGPSFPFSQFVFP